MFGKVHAQIVSNTTQGQNTDFLASDFQLERDDSLLRISISSGARAFKLIPSTGESFFINDASALTNLALYTEELTLDTGRTWNIQSTHALGATITHLVIQEVSGTGSPDGMYARKLAEITSQTIKAAGADILSSDFSVARADSIVRITVATSLANANIGVSPSTGNAFLLNNASDIPLGTVVTEDLVLDTSRTFNLITNSPGGIAVEHLIVQELSGVKW